uniref:Uncharacterized protein n=1 Tax=Sphaerodactylus townsendi TaxID=933632 RepID=A0ACB8G2A9_9SAUR
MIYHSSVDETGQVCLLIISNGNWKPSTKTEHEIQVLIRLVNEPELAHSLCPNLAEEFNKDYEHFLCSAEDHTYKFNEKQPYH